MQIKVSDTPNRKLVAVLGSNHGMFLPRNTGGVVWVEKDGRVTNSSEDNATLEDALARHPGRRGVYEGQAITLEF